MKIIDFIQKIYKFNTKGMALFTKLNISVFESFIPSIIILIQILFCKL